MITDSYDIETQPIVSFADFYGEQKHLVDICVPTFSNEIYDSVLATFDCEKISEIQAVCGSIPIYRFTHKGKCIGFYLNAKAIPLVPFRMVAPLQSTMVFFALLWGILFFHEPVSVWIIGGTSLFVLGIVLLSSRKE